MGGTAARRWSRRGRRRRRQRQGDRGVREHPGRRDRHLVAVRGHWPLAHRLPHRLLRLVQLRIHYQQRRQRTSAFTQAIGPTAKEHTPRRRLSPLVVFSPIVPTPVRLGEDLPPSSWDPVPSPNVTMLGNGSPRFAMLMSQVAHKKKSPKVTTTKDKARAVWNPVLEKTLVELLHEHKTPDYRGQNGWTSEAWNKIVKEFHDREKYATFTKAQIQEKEKELKREYRMLKEARKQSGSSWNNDRFMIEAEPAVWKNIIISFPKIKKFRNKSFPLFEALGELYDGHTAEGTYNFTSTQPPQHPVLTQPPQHPVLTQLDNDIGDTEAAFPYVEETFAYQVQDVPDPTMDSIEADGDNGSIEQRAERAIGVRNNKSGKGQKRLTKGGNIEGLLEKYIDMRSKQAEDEAAELAKENEVAQSNNFSIKKCISFVNSMVELTKEEKSKAYNVFKDADNKEIF